MKNIKAMKNTKITPKVKFELLDAHEMALIKGSRSGVYQKNGNATVQKSKRTLWDYIWDLI